MKLIIKTVVIVLTLFGTCSGSSKQWQADVNFNNPNNWDSGKIPCANSRILFPETVNTVLLQTNISSIKELVLPSNGQILLPSDMVLSFSDQNAVDPGCDEGDVTFLRTDAESWFDPGNWKDLDGLVTVETERVPCEYDSVTFPQEKLFNVDLDLSVTVGQMRFSGKDYSTSLFASFLASETGKLQFTTGGASVTMHGSACPVTSGCACGNDDDVLMSKICNQYTCLPTTCRDAVTPVGGCCPLCGAILTMEYDLTRFNIATFKETVQDNYQPASGGRKRRQADSGAVNTYISKTSKKQIQMVLTDSEVGSSSGQTAIRLADQITIDIRNDPGFFGLTSVTMQSSTKGTGSQTGSLAGGSVAGIIIAIIIIVVIVGTLGFLVLRRRAMFFHKDEPLHADMEVQDMPVSFMEEIPGQPPAMYMQSFDNPMYTTSAQENLYDDPTRVPAELLAAGDIQKGSKKSKKEKGLPPETLQPYEVSVSFDNPNYATTQVETSAHEDKAVEKDAAEGVDISKQESES